MTDPTPTEQQALDAMHAADQAWDDEDKGLDGPDWMLAMLRAIPTDVLRALTEDRIV